MGGVHLHIWGEGSSISIVNKPPKFKLEMTREGTGRRIMETEVEKKRPGEKVTEVQTSLKEK